MRKVKTKNGKVYVLDAPYWAGEHSFTHYSNMAMNDRGDFNELWAVDVYRRKKMDPLVHEARGYLWADSGAKSAAKQVSHMIEDNVIVLITHIIPLEDRLRDPERH